MGERADEGRVTGRDEQGAKRMVYRWSPGDCPGDMHSLERRGVLMRLSGPMPQMSPLFISIACRYSSNEVLRLAIRQIFKPLSNPSNGQSTIQINNRDKCHDD